MLIGAAAGGGLAAAIGPKDEPLWKKMLVGGGLGATAGLGLGAAMPAGSALGASTVAPTAAAPLATPAVASAAPVVPGGAAGLGLPSGLAPLSTINAGATQAATPFIGGSAASGAQAVGSSVAATQAAQSGVPLTSFGATPGFDKAVLPLGKMMANHPYLTAGGLGAVGLLALPGGNNRGRRNAAETYPQDASWEERRSYPRFYGYPSVGGVGRGFYS